MRVEKILRTLLLQRKDLNTSFQNSSTTYFKNLCSLRNAERSMFWLRLLVLGLRCSTVFGYQSSKYKEYSSSINIKLKKNVKHKTTNSYLY